MAIVHTESSIESRLELPPRSNLNFAESLGVGLAKECGHVLIHVPLRQTTAVTLRFELVLDLHHRSQSKNLYELALNPPIYTSDSFLKHQADSMQAVKYSDSTQRPLKEALNWTREKERLHVARWQCTSNG